MKIDPSIFKAYDIRGIYPDQLNEKNIVPIIKGIYFFLKKRYHVSQIVIGHDMRLSSPLLFSIIKETLLKEGANVIDIGLSSTPTLYFAVFHYLYDAGIQLTASHNPPSYNGLKIVVREKKGLVKIGKPTGMEEIKTLVLEGKELKNKKKGKLIIKNDVLNDEIDFAFNLVKPFFSKKLKVVADPANGMGALYLEKLFEKLPFDLIKINFKLDGSFPSHLPNPLIKKNLELLQKTVIEKKADLGIAPDGDGDRVFFVDEKGEIIPASVITGIVASQLLNRFPHSTILFDIRYVFNPKNAVEKNNGKWQITKVGHAFITEAMNNTKAIFAGESSGHYYFQNTGGAEAQIPVILFILSLLSSTKKSMSTIVSKYTFAYESGEYNFQAQNGKEIIEKIKEKFKDGKVNTLDGVSIDYPDWRFGVRASNTEPLIRLNLEAYNKNLMKKKLKEIIDYIKSLGGELIEE